MKLFFIWNTIRLLLRLVSIWTLFAFCYLFSFFVPTKNQNEQCNVQKETSKKTKQETKAITSNQRHFSVWFFDSISKTRLILFQKQERAIKSSKKQLTTNGNTPKKTKTSNNEQQKSKQSTFHSTERK